MKELPFPLRRSLEEHPAEDAAVERVLAGGRARHRTRVRRRRVATSLTASASALALSFLWLRGGHAQPLTLASGALPGALTAGPDGRAEARFSEGSRVTVWVGPLRFERNDGAVVATSLAQGRARFELTPGGPRRWSVQCEGVLVEVTGTVFDVERDPTASVVRVSVSRGSVSVRGPRVPATYRELRAGEHLEVPYGPSPSGPTHVAALQPAPEPSLAVAPSAPPSSPAATRPRARAPEAASTAAALPAPPPAQPAAPVPAAPSWRELAREGSYGQAWQSLGDDGFATAARAATTEELLALADVARLSGHPAQALEPLERALREARDPGSAPVIAFMLGRLRLDALAQPSQAAEALRRALALSPPRSLEADVRARLVEALSRAHRSEEARAEAQRFLERYPEDRRAAAVRRWGALP